MGKLFLPEVVMESAHFKIFGFNKKTVEALNNNGIDDMRLMLKYSAYINHKGIESLEGVSTKSFEVIKGFCMFYEVILTFENENYYLSQSFLNRNPNPSEDDLKDSIYDFIVKYEQIIEDQYEDEEEPAEKENEVVTEETEEEKPIETRIGEIRLQMEIIVDLSELSFMIYTDSEINKEKILERVVGLLQKYKSYREH